MRVRCVCLLLFLVFGPVEASYQSNFSSASSESSFAFASFNIYAWAPNIHDRLNKMTQWFGDSRVLDGVSALFVQESLDAPCGGSSAHDLAMRMGWDYYFQARPNDIEGLAFVYPPHVKVLSESFYTIQAKYNEDDYTRIALNMQIQDPVQGKVRFINVHLAHEHFMAETRKAQISEILLWIEDMEQRSPSSLIVMGGDFNTDPDKDFYADEFALLEDSSLAFTRSLSTGASFTWQDASSGTREHLDHFFVAKRGTPLDSLSLLTEIFTYPTEEGLSDHNFLRAMISF